jgi:hypothetical protein
MAKATIHPNRGADQIRALLAQPEIAGLVADLQATRWTGRRGYPVGTMVGMVLVKSLYVLPTWTRAVALVAEHDALRAAVGCVSDVPSIDACYRFTRKLRQHKGMLDACVAAVIVSLKEVKDRSRPHSGTHRGISADSGGVRPCPDRVSPTVSPTPPNGSALGGS